MEVAVEIRRERPTDHDAVRQVVTAAFQQADEARMVDAVRACGAPYISLVADIDGAVVGHVLFSPVTVDERPTDPLAMGLAPMAVAPAHQRAGIGGQLITRGVQLCRQARAPFVTVLGHPAYYPRFGFVRASQFGLRYVEEVPDEVFMALPLDDASDKPIPAGVIRYLPAFSA